VAAQPTYILSDRMVPESRILFYRYGEHLATEAVNAWGQRVALHRGQQPPP
jgi:hypothetical protein